MLPGKIYTPEDYVWMAWRRKWLIVVPALVAGLAAAAYAYQLPNRYQSSTSILIVPQRVPTDYVRPAVSQSIEDRLQVIQQQILSRTRLERIIQEFNLYEQERATMIMEDIVTRMRRDIGINVPAARNRRSTANSFTVSFAAENPRTAMQVTERIASLFVQENLEVRELQADATSQFLQAQLESARRRLLDHEAKIEEFKQRNQGQLPTQVQSNLGMMQNAQNQLQTLLESNIRDRDRLAQLQQSVAEHTANLAASAAGAAAVGGGAAGDLPAGTAAQQLQAARAQLAALELRLKPDHPDVARARRVVTELEAKAEAEALAQPLSPVVPVSAVGLGPVERATAARISEMRMEIDTIQRRLESRRGEETRLQSVVSLYRTRADAAPSLEAEFTELTRDYDTYSQSYTNLLSKSEEARVAVELERRQIGERFVILDGARLPERPTSPNRMRLNLMGLLAGLGLGVGLVALLEYRDTSLKTDDDVLISLSLPVLAVIPQMMSEADRRARTRRYALLAAGASVVLMVVATAAVVAWRLELFERWMR
jgi:polysaccharide chain length determinant protein (PEP-CTERM system associated)